jgi:hypothetical protein
MPPKFAKGDKKAKEKEKPLETKFEDKVRRELMMGRSIKDLVDMNHMGNKTEEFEEDKLMVKTKNADKVPLPDNYVNHTMP